MTILDDNQETHAAALSLIAAAEAINPSGVRAETVSLAVQQLIAPLRYRHEDPGEILIGVAKALGCLTAFAQPETTTGAVMTAILNRAQSEAYSRAAADIRRSSSH